MARPFDRIMVIDFETTWGRAIKLGFSSQTMEEYLRDPRFKAWGLSWCIIEADGSHREKWVTGAHLKDYFFTCIDWSRTAVVAQNAAFDVSIASWHYGVKPAFIFDTLSMGRALHGVEVGNSLKKLAERYGLPAKMEGLSPTENITDVLPREVENTLATYCCHDSWLAAELFLKMLPHFPQKELQLIDMTVRMYSQPWLELDKPMLELALKEDTEALAAALARVNKTEEELASNDIFAGVLQLLGVDPPLKPSPSNKDKMIYAFAKNDALFQQLAEGDNEDVALLCEARLKVKSTQGRTRAQRFIDIATRGALPVPLNYFGAASGRWQASKGSNINLQNMKRGSALRKAIMAPPGYVCIVGDLSQIEPRVLAWLADYEALLAIFRSGVDAYAVFGATMFGVPGMTKETHPVLRQSAKSALLGAGYMLGWAAFAQQLLVGFLGAPPKRYTIADAKQMGITSQEVVNFANSSWCMERVNKIAHTCTDDELIVHCVVAKEIIDRYRATAKPIVDLWGVFGQLIKRCLLGGETFVFKCLTFEKGAILLPNGMRIRYPELEESQDERGRPRYTYLKGKKREFLHPGVVTNNVTQGLARVVMSDGMLRVAKRLPVVLTVHDELAALAREEDGEKALPWVLRRMTEEPPYLPGIPLAADGGVNVRYGEAKQ